MCVCVCMCVAVHVFRLSEKGNSSSSTIDAERKELTVTLDDEPVIIVFNRINCGN